ncbi:MAG: ABC transporter permease, partial [Ruminobacter sp.]|nr:ABC transporter permease [Ruminobacter sp.]
MIKLKMNCRRSIRNLLVIGILFIVLFSSLFLQGLASFFDEYISDKVDLFLYLQADISGRGAYEETQLFLNLNDSLKKNSFERSDISQTERRTYKTAADESFASILYFRNEKAVSHALLGEFNDEEFDELFKSLCYDYKTGEIRGIINGNGIELHSDNEFVDLYPYLKLVQGRQFTLEETETGDNVCLIDEGMVQIVKTASGYSVKEFETGDTVYITKKVFNDDYTASEDFMLELKVVGIVEAESVNGTPANQVFIPEKTMERILKEHGFTEVYKDRTKTDINWDFGLVNIYKLSSLSQLEKLKKQIDKYKSDNWIYYTSLDKYGYSGMADLVLSISKSFRIVS